jgi:hypothetical protein
MGAEWGGGDPLQHSGHECPGEHVTVQEDGDVALHSPADGKTVHVGCVGGHGRTGIVISAIVAELTGKKDAIQWVRKHYCKKAVESKAQVQFLMKHYGVTEVTGTKSGGNGNGKWHSLGPASSSTQHQQLPESKVKQIPPEGVTAKTKQFSPMPRLELVEGQKAVIDKSGGLW